MEFPGACKVLRFHSIHVRPENKAEKDEKKQNKESGIVWMNSIALLSQHDCSEVTGFDGKQRIGVCFSEEASELL